MTLCALELRFAPLFLGVKQEPWWPFLKFEHLMVPLLHCLIGIDNNLINRFCDVVNEYVENLSAAEIFHFVEKHIAP